jgi:hypothetical protein
MILGELKYEIDSLYVSTEIILNGQYRVPPLDGLLLEACLIHFRVVWDFFYAPSKRKPNDVLVGDFVPQADFDRNRPAEVDRLRKVRRWLNSMLAHLSTDRIDARFKAGEITKQDIELIRHHTEQLFAAFVSCLPAERRAELINPIARKFAGYTTLG